MRSFPVVVAGFAALFPLLAAQTPDAVDPTQHLRRHALESAQHRPLPEEFIWTRSSDAATDTISYSGLKADEQVEPHYFRAHFNIAEPPAQATLYLAGPRSTHVFINGQDCGIATVNPTSPLGTTVLIRDVAHALRRGDNVIAIEAVRGKGMPAFLNSAATAQVTQGRILAAKLIARAEGVDGPALLLSDGQWKSTTGREDRWNDPAFRDSAWQPVASLGEMESNIDFLQWNADAGLYRWPGYDGISPFLAHLEITPQNVLHMYSGSGALDHVTALTAPSSADSTADQRFAVQFAGTPRSGEQPVMTLDFGRELNGRLKLVSDADQPIEALMQFGESLEEAEKSPYLGVLPIHIAPRSTAYGPKTAFRYAKLTFLSGPKEARFANIAMDAIYYPVEYRGSFQSSDPLLNRIWALGAYTAHLCMQDGIWDAPKRDRGRWMGDLDVSGRVIDSVFADHLQMEDTMDRLLGTLPVHQHVNGIPGYSAFWVTGQAEYWRHFGDRSYLAKHRDGLVQLLRYMESELDERHIYRPKESEWPFVDWSYDLERRDDETTRATDFEYLLAMKEGSTLLREAGDGADADHFAQLAEQMQNAAVQGLRDADGSYGDRWQTNAMAVLSGAADPEQAKTIGDAVLAKVGTVEPYRYIISPYYGYYVLSAMAATGHRDQALAWIRQYWGGMVAEGATSFWEGYDPSWYKNNFHASLQADDTTGYNASLAHGWSSGPTVWLMEEVLGIHPTAAGFSRVRLRPDLLGLAWAEGGEPTPRGLLHMRVEADQLQIDLPEGTAADVSVPVRAGARSVLVNDRSTPGEPVEDGTRVMLHLDRAGRTVIRTR